MSTSKSLIELNSEYTVYGYIRRQSICPAVIKHIILLHCYLFEILSQIVASIINPLHTNKKDTQKKLARLRYYLHNHSDKMHKWSEEVLASISLISVYLFTSPINDNQCTQIIVY